MNTPPPCGRDAVDSVKVKINAAKAGYVTDMAEADVEERIAMRAAGHVNAETHWIYTNIDKRIAKELPTN